MICRLLSSASVAGPTSSFEFGWLCFFFFFCSSRRNKARTKEKIGTRQEPNDMPSAVFCVRSDFWL